MSLTALATCGLRSADVAPPLLQIAIVGLENGSSQSLLRMSTSNVAAKVALHERRHESIENANPLGHGQNTFKGVEGPLGKFLELHLLRVPVYQLT